MARSSKTAKKSPARPASAAAPSEGRGTHGHVLWKGAITFGLVLVPVELHSAAKKTSLDLSMLEKKTNQPIGYKRINKITGKEVPYENIVKGYEYEKGQYVVLGDEDFKRANPKATQTVEILEFVEAGQIPVMYYDTPYYLVPSKQGAKVYALLRETMKKAGCVAVATVIIQTRQHLAALIPDERMLLLNTLRFADEIRDSADLHFPEAGADRAGVKSGEIAMAQKLIDSMRGEWDPSQYHDTYHEDIMARVHEKIKAGQTSEVPEPEKAGPPRRTAEVIDLMALLKNSIPGAKKGAPRARERESLPVAAAKYRAKASARSAPQRKRAA